VLAADFVDVRHQRVHFGHGSIQLDKKECAAIGIIGVHGGLGGLDRQVIHHFNRCWKHAGCDDPADGGAGFVGAMERREQSSHAFRPLHDAQGDPGGDPQRPL
jgi:hypothetical protein